MPPEAIQKTFGMPLVQHTDAWLPEGEEQSARPAPPNRLRRPPLDPPQSRDVHMCAWLTHCWGSRGEQSSVDAREPHNPTKSEKWAMALSQGCPSTEPGCPSTKPWYTSTVKVP
eukprot:1195221-Prorocentrum_minimum.AAC.5